MDADTESQLFDEEDDPECEFFEESDVTRLQNLEDMEKMAREIMDLMKEDIHFVRRIHMRMPRHIAAVDEVAKCCRAAIDGFGLWREDEADLEEIYDGICEKADSIVQGFRSDQAMSFALDSHELVQCRDVAASVLAGEQYLSGAELEFLDEVVSCEIFDVRRLLQIGGNHDRCFKLMVYPG